MNSDIQDILSVFLINALSAILQNQTASVPSGLADLLYTEALENTSQLTFPADIRELLYVYILNQNRI